MTPRALCVFSNTLKYRLALNSFQVWSCYLGGFIKFNASSFLQQLAAYTDGCSFMKGFHTLVVSWQTTVAKTSIGIFLMVAEFLTDVTIFFMIRLLPKAFLSLISRKKKNLRRLLNHASLINTLKAIRLAAVTQWPTLWSLTSRQSAYRQRQ